jgi:hypothetical protein
MTKMSKKVTTGEHPALHHLTEARRRVEGIRPLSETAAASRTLALEHLIFAEHALRGTREVDDRSPTFARSVNRLGDPMWIHRPDRCGSVFSGQGRPTCRHCSDPGGWQELYVKVAEA